MECHQRFRPLRRQVQANANRSCAQRLMQGQQAVKCVVAGLSQQVREEEGGVLQLLFERMQRAMRNAKVM